MSAPAEVEFVETDESWAEPINILGELATRRFDASDVTPELGEFAIAYAAATGIDRSLCITAAVSAAAAALSDEFQIVPDSRTTWMQSARLWFLAIARPGAGKSPAQKEMLKPLWVIQRELVDAHERAIATMSDDDAKPPRPRLVLIDTTVEALADILKTNKRGVIIFNDEFEGWIGAMDMYRGGKGPSRDRAEWLRLFDGGPHTVERIQRGSALIENWGVSVLSATTPATLDKLTRHLPEDGLLQRFLLVCAHRPTFQVVPQINLEAARESYHETIRRLYFAQARAHQGKVPLSGEAALFFAKWRSQNAAMQEAMGSMSSPFESHLAKHPTLVLRVALVFHAAQIVNQEHELARDIAAWPVTLQTMQRAARFMQRATQHAMAVYLGKSRSDAYELARDIGRAVIAHGTAQITRRDLLRGVPAFKRADEHLQRSALSLLVDAGWLRAGEGGYRKPEPTRYEVNPALAVKMAEEAKRERERRAIVREAILEAAQEARRDG